MEKQYRIGYYILTDIQHIPPIMNIYGKLGGIILTKNHKICDFIKKKYSDIEPDIYLVKNSSEARRKAIEYDLKIIIYTGFQMIFWGFAIQIFHGTSDKKYVEDKRILLYDKVYLTGQKMLDKIKNAGLYKFPERFELIGYPKFDHIIKSRLSKTNHTEITILYAPTWISENSGSKVNFSEYGESSLPLWGKKLIRAIAPQWKLIIKYHSRVNKNAKGIYSEIRNFIKTNNFEERVKIVWDADISFYMEQADIIITDISAVSYEWFHFDRPILFANPSPGNYKPLNDKFSNTYAWNAGDLINNENDIVPLIEKNLHKDEYKKNRTELLYYAFFKPDGNALNRQINSIKNLYSRIESYSKYYIIMRNLKKFLKSLVFIRDNNS